MSTNITQGDVKDAQVSSEVQRQSNLTGELREIIDKLKARLANVMSEVPEKMPIEAEPESPSLVLLASEIAGSNDGVANCILALKTIVDRLEI